MYRVRNQLLGGRIEESQVVISGEVILKQRPEGSAGGISEAEMEDSSTEMVHATGNLTNSGMARFGNI